MFFPEWGEMIPTRTLKPGERFASIGTRTAVSGEFRWFEELPDGTRRRVNDIDEARARNAKLIPAMIADEVVVKIPPTIFMTGDRLEFPVVITSDFDGQGFQAVR